MKLSCLINSHNYVDYVVEAISSALAQTRPFHEIIVVDDGSTDGSVEAIRRHFCNQPQVRLIVKKQAGQLSCFHLGCDAVTGDVVFFLDADDRYRPDMLRRAAPIYENRPANDFLSVGFQEFGQKHRHRRLQTSTRDRGISVLGALFHRLWIGNPTSCLSMRTELLRKILPYPNESDWITRADDVLVFGASVVGGHKYHLEQPLVEYRIHDHNGFARRKLSQSEKMKYALRVNRMIAWYASEMGYDESMLPHLLPREFRTLECPTWKEFRQYRRMSSRAKLSWVTQVEQAAMMLSHYLKERLAKHEETELLPTAMKLPQSIDSQSQSRAA